MKLAKVVGTVVSTIKSPIFDDRALLLVDLLEPDGRPSGGYLIALDTVGAGAGETVLVLDEGTSARQIVGAPFGPLRTVVVGIVDAVEGPAAVTPTAPSAKRRGRVPDRLTPAVRCGAFRQPRRYRHAMTDHVHPLATRGFGGAADAYERGRPGYPAEATAAIAQLLDLRSGRTVLDLAAGTGKMTRALVPTGARVIAVEPVAEMRAKLRHDGTGSGDDRRDGRGAPARQRLRRRRRGRPGLPLVRHGACPVRDPPRPATRRSPGPGLQHPGRVGAVGTAPRRAHRDHHRRRSSEPAPRLARARGAVRPVRAARGPDVPSRPSPDHRRRARPGGVDQHGRLVGPCTA